MLIGSDGGRKGFVAARLKQAAGRIGGMESVVIYILNDGTDRARVLDTYPRHKAYFEAFRANGGGLLALGPFLTADPAGSSMGFFTSREDAERFIADDPFVVEGLAVPRILDWDPVRFE